jgi:hypothetical protein
MSENLPFIWRKYYRNEAASSEKVLETVHEQVRQYLSRHGGMEIDAIQCVTSCSRIELA